MRDRKKERRRSPSAVLILEVLDAERVWMMKTKYSSRERRQGKRRNVEMNWPEYQQQETLLTCSFVMWTGCDKHFHLISKLIQK